jgi:hypothetical protein
MGSFDGSLMGSFHGLINELFSWLLNGLFSWLLNGLYSWTHALTQGLMGSYFIVRRLWLGRMPSHGLTGSVLLSVFYSQ